MDSMRVNFFQRKPRKGFDFSLEYIFDDVRKRLSGQIEAKVYVSKLYNNGFYTKFVNIIEAAFRQGRDVNHITGELNFLNLLMVKRRVVLTILDCGMMPRKTGLSRKIVQWLYLYAPVRRAHFITAISEVTKQEIVKYSNCDPDSIHVIPVAINPLFISSPKTFNKDKPVILHIGAGVNKNLVRLIEALKGIECHLTIVGGLSDLYLEALKVNAIEYSNEYNITNERLLEKYKECDIIAFVSTFEGFGMPIVEANVVERVVVTSNISSMPEVAADAACLVNPYDTESIRAGILKVINNDIYRQELIENGKINKLRFEADAIANRYCDLYKKIVNGKDEV